QPQSGLCPPVDPGTAIETRYLAAAVFTFSLGATQSKLSVTVTAPFFPVALTTFVPLCNLMGHVKMQFVLLRVPCDAPFKNNSTESQSAYPFAVNESASRFVK